MANWITKAVNVFRKEEARGPQPFEVACACGQMHSGIRRSRHQHLICKDCGTSLFVLPRDVFPAPLGPKPTAKKKKRSKPKPIPAELSEGDLIKESEGEETDIRTAPPVLPKKKTKQPPKKRGRQRKKVEEADEEVSVEAGPGLLVLLGERLGLALTAFRNYWTPLRSIFAAIFLFALLTVTFTLRENALSRAAKTIKEQQLIAEEAITAEDWLPARDALAKVTAALDLLKRDDGEARRLRQLDREVNAATRLAPVSIFDLLDEAEQVHADEGAEIWASRFGAYRGTWIVIDGPIRSVRQKKEQHFELFLPWRTLKDRKVKVILGSPQLDEAQEKLKDANLIYAGELTDCRLNEAGDEWTIEFDAESGFLWANTSTFAPLGLPDEDDADYRDRLEQQAAAIGVSDDG